MEDRLLATLATRTWPLLLSEVLPFRGEVEGELALELRIDEWENAVELTPQQAMQLSRALWVWADSQEPGILLRAVEGECKGEAKSLKRETYTELREFWEEVAGVVRDPGEEEGEEGGCPNEEAAARPV